MKKHTATQLRNLLSSRARIVNESSFFRVIAPAPPVVTYRKTDRHLYARWLVTRVGYKTDPEGGHFLDGHNKTFLVVSADQKQSELVLALSWASEKYGYPPDEWVKTPFGSWAPKTALDTALRHHLPHLFAEEGEDATPVEPSGVIETTIHTPIDRVTSPTVETDGWYRVVGANVAVFIRATNADDAEKRVQHMIQRMTMDCSLELHITKRDPEVD